jgi:uracil-DNA glycosylase family 4
VLFAQVRSKVLSALQREIAACTVCASVKPWRQFAASVSGTPATGYLLVGEAPGYVSWKNRRRFTGPAGMLIRRALQGVGHSCYRDLEDLFYMTDVVKCHPAAGHNPLANRSPVRSEVKACSNYLIREIQILEPSVIVTFGRLATEQVHQALGQTGNGVNPTVLSFPHPSPRNQAKIREHYPSRQAFEQTLTDTFCGLIADLERHRSHA